MKNKRLIGIEAIDHSGPVVETRAAKKQRLAINNEKPNSDEQSESDEAPDSTQKATSNEGPKSFMSLPRELRQQILVQSIDDPQTELDVYKFISSYYYPWNWFEAFSDYQEKANIQAKVLRGSRKRSIMT